MDDGDSISSLHLFQRGFDSRLQAKRNLRRGVGFAVMTPDQAGEHFCISRGEESVSICNQTLFERGVIFNDPVVHESNLRGGIEMGMGVCIAGFTMCRPTGVGDTGSSRGEAGRDFFCQCIDAARGFQDG